MCLPSLRSTLIIVLITRILSFRLRQVDVKAEHFERQVQRVEQERDQWERKYEVRELTPRHYRHNVLRSMQEADARYRQSKAELDELVSNMEGL